MKNNTFDAFTRLCAKRASRRSTLRAAVIGVVVAATKAPRSGAAQTSDAGVLILELYENVNVYRYEQAYALLGAA